MTAPSWADEHVALARALRVRPENLIVSDLAPPNGAIIGSFGHGARLWEPSPPRPVASTTTPLLHAHVMAAAAKACARKAPRWGTVRPPWTVPSAHFTIDAAGHVWDHTPYLRGHSHTPPNRPHQGPHHAAL